MARAGDSTLRISPNQPSILRRAHRTAARQGFRVPEARNMPSWEWMLSGSYSRRAKRGYNNGLHPARGTDDGDSIRLSRSWNTHVLDDETSVHRAATRRIAEHEIRPDGNLRGFG